MILSERLGAVVQRDSYYFLHGAIAKVAQEDLGKPQSCSVRISHYCFLFPIKTSQNNIYIVDTASVFNSI
jgi:hypothetical protein